MSVFLQVLILIAAVLVYLGLTWLLSRNMADRIDARLNFRQWRPNDGWRRNYDDKQ